MKRQFGLSTHRSNSIPNMKGTILNIMSKAVSNLRLCVYIHSQWCTEYHHFTKFTKLYSYVSGTTNDLHIHITMRSQTTGITRYYLVFQESWTYIRPFSIGLETRLSCWSSVASSQTLASPPTRPQAPQTLPLLLWWRQEKSGALSQVSMMWLEMGQNLNATA